MRAKGRRRLILEDGVLRLGGLYAVLSAVGGYFFKYGLTSSRLGEYWWSGETIFKFLFGWLVIGFVMGSIIWYVCEREFSKPGKDKA